MYNIITERKVNIKMLGGENMTQEERDNVILKINESVTDLSKDVSSLKEDMTEVKEDISYLKEETRNISGSVAVIEKEHGEKIQALLDGHKGIVSKLDSINERFKEDENRLDNHTFRINSLETKFESKIANQ